MTNNSLIISAVVLCSLGGWYVVLNKYFDLRDRLKEQDKDNSKNTKTPPSSAAKINRSSPEYKHNPALESFGDFDFATDQHIPGMGPPPLANLPFQIPPEVLESMRRANQAATTESPRGQSQQVNSTNPQPTKTNPSEHSISKREVCNLASLLHLSGLCFVIGIPFLNIIIPTMLWLLKKEQHPYIAKQGREVINFQITFTMIQFLCLGVGVVFIWLFPSVAASLFAWTKTARVVFATSMQLPFNLFTVVPFFWACTLVLRGAVAAYHGVSFKYPYAQPFITDSHVDLVRAKQTAPVMQRKEPQVPEAGLPGGLGKINFG